MAWWQDFFDSTYRELWSHLHPPEICQAEAEQIVALLDLRPGDRLLDAPCGYGRVALPLARLGLEVTGIDFSRDLLEHAKAQGSHVEPPGALSYREADLRHIEIEGEFKAAINLFSSIGYGGQDDDLKILGNLHRALRPGGTLLVETIHRDAIVHHRSLGNTKGVRGPDGIVLREKTEFDPCSGTIDSTWTWNSPTRSGSKHSVIRIYSATEIVGLLQRVGFVHTECFVGLSRDAFTESTLGERLGVVATKASA